MVGITPVLMGVMVFIFYKKDYVMCRNSIYNSKYTLHDKQKRVLYSYDKTLENCTMTYIRSRISAYQRINTMQ